MKRISVFILALLLLLPACGRIAPEPVIEITTTIKEELTTEASTEPGGESAEITWRTLDVNSAEGREAVQWLAEEHQQWEESWENPQTEFPMGNDKTIAYKGEYNRDIVLRDNKTGKETMLLETTYIGNATTPEEAAADEVFWKSPLFVQALDDRYFVYDWGGWEWRGDTGVYDTKNMRVIPIEWDKKYNEDEHFWGTRFCDPQIFADALYLTDASHGPYYGPVHLMYVDLRALDAVKPGQSLIAVDILEGIPGVEDAQESNWHLVSQNERYFIIADTAVLRIYDLRQKKLALELPASISGFDENESYWWPDSVIQRGDRVYWTDDWTGEAVNSLAEITLP